MSEGMFSTHAALNAGAIPASAEELSQRHSKLFQQYSRLKAQHAVLKVEMNKQQISNQALKGNVKEKDKELRKLQEQLDLLAFHNERLTKRIQAVQDNESKSSHFSLLGGSVKKELEKSSQALEEANLDLERKIQENEELHKELKDRQIEFTDNINILLKQIQDFEKKIQELQDENAALQTESNQTIAGANDQEQETKQLAEIDSLKKELADKSNQLNLIKENDIQLVSEIQSLRAILLAKVENLKKELGDTSLYEVIPKTSDALIELENQTKQYLLSNGEKNELNGLPAEIAEKLAIFDETYSVELNKLCNEKDEKLKLSDSKINSMLSILDNDKDSLKKLEELNQDLEKEIQNLQSQLEEKSSSLNQMTKELNDTKSELTITKSELSTTKNDLSTIKNDLFTIRNELCTTKNELSTAKNELSTTKQTLEKAVQENTTKEEEEEEEEVFVYPTSNTEKEQEEDEDEEEVFVYRGMDAVQEDSIPVIEEKTTNEEEVLLSEEKTTNDESKEEKSSNEEEILLREEKLKAYYEQKLSVLTEKIQLTDSKAYRFASMYKGLKEKLVKEEKEKELMMQEIERLNKEVKNVQDLLSTTESNYQKQIDTMTEFITSLQQNAEDQQQRQYHQQRRPNHRA